MKTKFSDLLKIKDRNLKEIEKKISLVIADIDTLEKEIEDIDNEIKEFKSDLSGEFALFQIQKSFFTLMIEKKDELLKDKTDLDMKLELLKSDYKMANIEYEKIAYLHKEEEKKLLEELKVKESKMMDEVANILFNKKEKEEYL